MYLGDAVFTSEIINQPTLLDQIEDTYVVVIEEQPTLWPARFSKGGKQRELDQVVTMMHEKGWETVDVTFARPYSMVVLLLNPRAKRSQQSEMEG